MVETGSVVRAEPLLDFCVRVFEKMGVVPTDAHITADVLVVPEQHELADGVMTIGPDAEL